MVILSTLDFLFFFPKPSSTMKVLFVPTKKPLFKRRYLEKVYNNFIDQRRFINTNRDILKQENPLWTDMVYRIQNNISLISIAKQITIAERPSDDLLLYFHSRFALILKNVGALPVFNFPQQ